MIIFIPSRSRYDRVGRGPLRQLSAAWRAKTVVAVPMGQGSRYAEAMEVLGYSGVRLVTVPDDWRIGQKRRYLGEFAAEEKEEQFLFLDDDIGFLVRYSPEDWRLREPATPEVDTMLGYLEHRLQEDSLLSHAGISAREGNNRAGVGNPATLWGRNTRIMRAVAWKTRAYLETDPTRIPGIEDFDCSLQSLRAGYENLCLYYWAQGQRETQEAGGCADWRTAEVHAANVRRLAELHAPYVRIREKKNKTGGLAERLESTIAWKAAAAEGAALREQRERHEAAVEMLETL